jgi:putative hydrolase of the HAD superfamily
VKRKEIMKEKKAVLFDIDNTLVFGPQAEFFYQKYSRGLELKIAEVLNVPLWQAVELANDSRRRNDGQGELVFEENGLDALTWYEGILAVSPIGVLIPLPEVLRLIQRLRKDRYILGLITDGPTAQARAILKETRIDPSLFEFLWGWERSAGKPKNGKTDVFMQASERLGLPTQAITMVGDSLRTDVLPARAVGMQGVYINKNRRDGEEGIINVLALPSMLRK